MGVSNLTAMPKGRLNQNTWTKNLTERGPRREYIGDDLRCVAMPLGGIGTGTVALCGDGSLRQWQLVNQVNHSGYVPHSFFALWLRQPGHEPVAYALQTKRFFAENDFLPAKNVNDHVVPRELIRWVDKLPCVWETRFIGEYPIAEISYHERDMPVEIRMEAFSPFQPFDSDTSGIPAVLFTFKVHNKTKHRITASLMASQQNFVGWDGATLIREAQNPGYGGNQNRLHRVPGRYTLEMVTSRLPDDHTHWGEVALAAFADEVTSLPQWDDVEQMWYEFSRDGEFKVEADSLPSAPWRTWAGSLASKFPLGPDETREITFLLAWYFPNRVVNWDQPVDVTHDKKTKFWLGNHYNRFGSALRVVQHVYERKDELVAAAHRFRDTMYGVSQPYWFLDAVTANIVPARTNICLQDERGEFYGFEGGNGASASWAGGVGGCCALNCTHVWNYEMTVARLWPDLDRSMRRTDWVVNQHETGYLPHRTTLPEYLPRLWGMKIGGPDNPALDGLFGGVLKTCREFLGCGDPVFLSAMWPHVDRAMEYAMTHCDTDGDGVIKGEQGNTYDIHLYGPNTFIGSLYLAALLAAARLADAAGKTKRAKAFRERFAMGSANYDKTCWNGEYFIQVVDLKEHPKHQFGAGCVSDQLLGQWWAHILGLGYVLPKDHVRSALASIFKYNFLDGFEHFVQQPRVFASGHDRGLLNASYKVGERPEVSLLYSDEVWTGVEYAVAGLMLHEGMTMEGLAIGKAVRDRYDGFERNPWNEVECGDHYVRSMSSWGMLDLLAGIVYEADSKRLRVGPRGQGSDFSGFFAAGTAYGVVEQKGPEVTIHVAAGRLPLSEIGVLSDGPATGSVDGHLATFERRDDHVWARLAETIELTPGQSLTIRLG